MSKHPMMRRLAAALLLLSGLLLVLTAKTATQSQVDAVWSKGLSWLTTTQTGEGNWKSAPGTDVITAALAVEAFRKAGVTGEAPSRALAWVANAPAYSADARARQAIALYNAGMNVDALMTTLVSMRNSNNRWGAYAGYSESFMDTALAMDAIAITGINTTDSQAGSQAGVNYILYGHNSDNGWPYVQAGYDLATPSRVVPSAHGLIAARRYGWWQELINGAAWLRAQQKANGSFGDGTLYETALAYAALAATADITNNANVAAMASALDYLVAQQQADGSWNHDAFLTALILQVLPAPSATPSITQNVNAIAGNGTNNTGLGAVIPLVPIVINQNTTMNLSGAVGQSPYLWKVIAGELPPGMSFSSSGIFSGTPSAPGNYNFTVQSVDASGNIISTAIYEIVVAGVSSGGPSINSAILHFMLD